MADPVLWAKAFVISNDAIAKKVGPWKARDYQEEMLRDKSLYKVYRCGRRCLTGDTLIMDPTDGKYYTILELYEKGSANVVAMDSNYTLKTQTSCPVMYNGEKEIFELTVQKGRSIKATGNHPFFTSSGWKELSDLKVGDYIAVPSELPFFGDNVIDDNDVKLLAYIIGDGNCTQKQIRFSQDTSTKQFSEMCEIVKHYDCELYHYESSKSPFDFGIRKIHDRYNRTVSNKVKEVLKKYKVFGHDANTKVIPNEIFTLKREQIALFLSRLFSTDGWASNSFIFGKSNPNIEIGYCSNSKKMIQGISHLLLRFGIDCTIRKKKKSWVLSIIDKKSIILFAENIGIYGKEEAVKYCLENSLNKNDIDEFMPPEINQLIDSEMKNKNILKSQLVALWEKNHRQQQRLRLDKYKLQKKKVSLISDFLKMNDLYKMSTSSVIWRKITSIKSKGIQDTYDLHVPEYNNFVANDIITHNTGKSETMIIEGLHKAYTHEGFRILYVTPYETQVNLVFMRMRELVQSSPLLKIEVTKMKNSPYTIEFRNGSVIMGFTTGASSGSGAASVRGQRAD